MYKSSFLIAALLCAGSAQAQTDGTAAANSAVAPMEQPKPSASILKRDTPLELLATKEISTADAVAGTKFRLRLNKPVVVDNHITIPAGTWAHGEVVSASDAGGLGKSGEMTARLLYLEVGEVRVPIDGTVNAKGTGAGSAGAAVIFAGVAGLFHRGNNAKIKAGEIVNAFVGQDTPLPLPTNATATAK